MLNLPAYCSPILSHASLTVKSVPKGINVKQYWQKRTLVQWWIVITCNNNNRKIIVLQLVLQWRFKIFYFRVSLNPPLSLSHSLILTLLFSRYLSFLLTQIHTHVHSQSAPSFPFFSLLFPLVLHFRRAIHWSPTQFPHDLCLYLYLYFYTYLPSSYMISISTSIPISPLLTQSLSLSPYSVEKHNR